MGEANPCLLRALSKMVVPLIVDAAQEVIPKMVEYDVFDMVVKYGERSGDSRLSLMTVRSAGSV